jgi:hypothetical protein
MIKVGALLWMLFFTASASATDCDCSIYPFKPNPPCFSICVAKLSSEGSTELSAVKNIDPEVSDAIKAISESRERSTIKFENINEKADLKREAMRIRNLEH